MNAALVATTFARISGHGQTGTVGKALDNPFVTEVRDQNGDGLVGITVTFAVTAGGTLSVVTFGREWTGGNNADFRHNGRHESG